MMLSHRLFHMFPGVQGKHAGKIKYSQYTREKNIVGYWKEQLLNPSMCIFVYLSALQYIIAHLSPVAWNHIYHIFGVLPLMAFFVSCLFWFYFWQFSGLLCPYSLNVFPINFFFKQNFLKTVLHFNSFVFFYHICVFGIPLHPSVSSALKWRGDERISERKCRFDPPFILMWHRSQSIMALLILFKANRERWSEAERVFVGSIESRQLTFVFLVSIELPQISVV